MIWNFEDHISKDSFILFVKFCPIMSSNISSVQQVRVIFERPSYIALVLTFMVLNRILYVTNALSIFKLESYSIDTETYKSDQSLLSSSNVTTKRRWRDFCMRLFRPGEKTCPSTPNVIWSSDAELTVWNLQEQ